MSSVCESALVPVFDMLVARLSALEDAAREQRKMLQDAAHEQREAQLHANEYAPAGTVIRGAIYRRPGEPPLTINKLYDTPAKCYTHDSDAVFYVDFQFRSGLMYWMPTSEWAHGEERTWMDDAVEEAIGVAKAAEVRRTLAACFDATPPLDAEADDITCEHAGLPETHVSFVDAWTEWAILRRFPDVVAVGGPGMIVRHRHYSKQQPLQYVVEIVDKVFRQVDILLEILDVYRIPAPFKDHAARSLRRRDTTAADVKLIWDGLNAGQRAGALRIMRNVRTDRVGCMMNFDFKVLSKLV